jgi:hypothetical protein
MEDWSNAILGTDAFAVFNQIEDYWTDLRTEMIDLGLVADDQEREREA